MDTFSLLIADSNEEFRLSLSRALDGAFRIYCCDNGEDALGILKKEQPDILVMDVMLPKLDGISLLHCAVEAGVFPAVLIATANTTRYVTDSAEELGVAYIMQKPCNIRATADRVRDLSRRIHHSQACAPDPKTHVSNILTTLGISTKHSGYRYLRDAILLVLESSMSSVTKEIYPTVGLPTGHSGDNVERAIRTAVEKAWKKRDDKIWMRFFQPDASGTVPKPSNAVFITQLADRLMLDQMEIPLP